MNLLSECVGFAGDQINALVLVLHMCNIFSTLYSRLWFHGDGSEQWAEVPKCTSVKRITGSGPTSPCWCIHQCPLFNIALHNPLRKTVGGK